MDIFKNFKAFGKSKSRDETSNLTAGCSELETDMHADDQSSSSAQSQGSINPPHTTVTQPSRTVSALFLAHPQSAQSHTTSTEPPTTTSALALDQAHRDARRLETDVQRLVSSITTAIQLSAAESSRLLSLVGHNTITPIISEATEPSRLLSLGEHNTLSPSRREKILDEKNQMILDLSEDRDGWKNTAEESFKREGAWADKAEKWKGVALKQGEKLRALEEVATKRGEKIGGLEEGGEVWCRKMIELEREVFRLKARAIEDSERIKELSRGVLHAEVGEDGWRDMAEKAEEVKREVEKARIEARE